MPKVLSQKLRQLVVQINTAKQAIFYTPYDIVDLIKDVREVHLRLRAVVLGGGIGPGPGPGPGSGFGHWKGTCEVVLETVWGTNIKSFFGFCSSCLVEATH